MRPGRVNENAMLRSQNLKSVRSRGRIPLINIDNLPVNPGLRHALKNYERPLASSLIARRGQQKPIFISLTPGNQELAAANSVDLENPEWV